MTCEDTPKNGRQRVRPTVIAQSVVRTYQNREDTLIKNNEGADGRPAKHPLVTKSKRIHYSTFLLSPHTHTRKVMSETPRNGTNGHNGAGILEAQRAKASMRFREDIAPGFTCEMELKRILAATESKYQKIDVLDTYFGRVGFTSFF